MFNNLSTNKYKKKNCVFIKKKKTKNVGVNRASLLYDEFLSNRKGL